jgi:hypothetical protein
LEGVPLCESTVTRRVFLGRIVRGKGKCVAPMVRRPTCLSNGGQASCQAINSDVKFGLLKQPHSMSKSVYNSSIDTSIYFTNLRNRGDSILSLISSHLQGTGDLQSISINLASPAILGLRYMVIHAYYQVSQLSPVAVPFALLCICRNSLLGPLGAGKDHQQQQ